MFTGLVPATGTVTDLTRSEAGLRIAVECAAIAARVKIGDSVAVNGICLTVSSLDGGMLHFDAIAQTIGRTTLGAWQRGTRVHLEPALRLGDPLGGHWVQGHVEGTAQVESVDRSDGQWRVRIAVDGAAEQRWDDVICAQGSIAVDGVSLTIAACGSGFFEVALIPHTLECTALGALRAGDHVNLEADPLARLVARLVARAVAQHLARQ
ncbi:MAG: riboflavin synthase [Planctomycetes bacterium]|nr:riboflavin synthase [Planctomycetota bacterium]